MATYTKFITHNTTQNSHFLPILGKRPQTVFIYKTRSVQFQYEYVL